MATPYQNLLDIDGLIGAIREAEAASDSFSQAATEDFKRVKSVIDALVKSAQKIKDSLNNNGRPIDLINAGDIEAITRLTTEVANLKRQVDDQRRAMANMQNMVNANTRATRNATQAEIDLRVAYQQGRVTAQQYRTECARIALEMRQQAQAARQAAQGMTAANGSYNEAKQRLKELGNEIRSVAGGFQSTSPAMRAQIAEYNKLNQALKNFDAQMGNHQRNVGDYSGAMGRLVGDLKSLALGYLSVQGALQLVKASFDANLKLDGVRASLEYTLGSADATEKKLDELRETAQRLGLEFTPLADTYAKFAGAAKASNFSMEQADRIFNSVSGAAARFHLTSDQLSGALLALQQMISKGTVQSEELRGQLGERLPGAFAIAARAMGKTEAELGKMLETGQVTANELLPKLATELDKTFSLDKNTKIESLTASTNNLKNAFDRLLQSDKVSGFFKTVLDGFTHLLNEIEIQFDSKRPLWERIRRGFSFNTDAFDVTDNIRAGKKFQAEANINPLGSKREFVVSALSTKSLADLEKLRKGYIDAAQKAADGVNLFKKGIKDGSLTEGEYSVKQAEADFNRIQKDLYMVTDAYHIVQKQQKGVTTGAKELTDAQLTSITAIRKRITELSKLPDSAVDGSVVNNRIDALKKRLHDLTPSTKQAKEGFAELEDKLKKVNEQLEIAILQDYVTNQGKESEHTKKLAADYNRLAKAIADVGKLKATALRGNDTSMPLNIQAAPGAIPTLNFNKEETRSAIDANYAALDDLNKRYAEFNVNKLKQLKAGAITETQYNEDVYDRQVSYLLSEYQLRRDTTDKELSLAKEGTAEYRRLNLQRLALDEEYNKKSLDLEKQKIDLIKARYQDIFSTIMDSANVIGGATGKLIGDLAGSVSAYGASVAKGGKAFTETEKLAMGMRLAGDAVGVYTDLSIEASKARMAQIEAEYQNELKLAGENDEAKTIINNEYNRRVREENIKQAKYQKAQAATEIIINTAISVSKALAQGGAIFGIPLAAVVGALGAVQLGLVLAQPLPQYAKGRDGGPGEWAMVNEQGPEAIGQGDRYRIPNQGKKGITWLNKGDRVLTAAMTQQAMNEGILQRSQQMADTMGGAKAIFQTYTLMMAQQKNLSFEETAEAMRMATGDIKVQHLSIDEQGQRRYERKVKDRMDFNRGRNRLN